MDRAHDVEHAIGKLADKAVRATHAPPRPCQPAPARLFSVYGRITGIFHSLRPHAAAPDRQRC